MLDDSTAPDPAVLATWLTIKEASRAYGVSVPQIRHWLLEGQVPAGRLPTASGWVWRIAPPPAPAPAAAEPAPVAALQAEIAHLRAALAACLGTGPPLESAPDGR